MQTDKQIYGYNIYEKCTNAILKHCEAFLRYRDKGIKINPPENGMAPADSRFPRPEEILLRRRS